jgi:hypothetical protein
MGGLAGHMSHLYDNPDLTFGEIKDIFIRASSGRLVGTEKTDGQNIFLSYSVKRGRPVAARNLGNIKTGGMSAKDLAAKFGGRGDLEKSFNDSFRAFADAVRSFSIDEQIDIFGPDANIWYNAEVQDPRTSNVINYDAKTLTIHRSGHKEFDKESGKPMDKDVTANAEALEGALEKNQYRGRGDYRVQMNAFRNLDAIGDDEDLNIALSKLYNLIRANGLSQDSTVLDFVVVRLKEVIDYVVPNISEEAKKLLLRRLLKMPGTNMRDVLKAVPAEDREKVRNLIKTDKRVLTAAVFPLEDIVHDFSVEMLRGLESAFVLDNAAEVERLRQEVSRAISAIEGSNNEKAMEILNKQMKKLKDIENVSTAAEGFVFDYDGVTYKFTGNFAPINQLLGLFRYGRGDVPAMELNEDDERLKRKADIAFVPGSFKPPHKGHWDLVTSYLKDAEKVVVLISDPQKDSSIRFIDMPGSDNKNKIEMTPNGAKNIFDIYINESGLEGDVQVWDIWENEGVNNPIQYIHQWLTKVGESGDKMTVALGVSAKDAGDEERFSKMKESFSKYPNLTLIPLVRQPLSDDVVGDVSATDMRDAITDALVGSDEDINDLQRYLPNGVNAETILKVVEKQPTWLVGEASSCAAGSIEGAASGEDSEETLIREEDNFMISRKEFIEELALRESIRSALSRIREKEDTREQRVRQAIRKMLQEEVKDAPYKSTGINELETLLKKIVPVIEPDYKSLTTAAEQRVSYRAHILNAVQNALSPTGASGAMHRDDIGVLDLPGEDDFGLEEDDTNEEISIAVAADDKFIDIEDKPAVDKEEEEQEKENEFSVEGEEETGRNFASMTWDRIETNIVDSYRKLSNNKDRELFYDYLIANLKLYFDKFEDELASIVDEPQSDIYDQEKEELGAAETAI